VRRPTIAALVVVTGLLLLADFLVVNEGLGEVAALFVDAAILVAAGAALAAAASLALRRGTDLWRRRGDPIGAALVLGGMAAVLVAGLRPGGEGAADPAVRWIVAALLVPLGATLFGLLFVTTLAAARRSVASRSREGTLLVAMALATTILLMPLSGAAGSWLANAAGWSLAVPVGAVFRGLLIGVALLTAVYSARTLLGMGTADE
jgi:hypothetical protein